MKKKGPIIPTTDNSLSFKVLSVAVILAFLPALMLPAGGQTSVWELPAYKESIKTFSIGGGKTTARETYLSNLTYKGPSVTIMNDVWKGFSPESTLGYGRSHTSVNLGLLHNEPRAGNMLYFNFDCFYSRAWHALHNEASDLLVGPAAMFRLGGFYTMIGSNNPGTGEGYLSLGVCADYVWRFNVRRIPFALQGSIYSPLAGMGISPDYDQPYWYVYRYKEYADLMHFAWVGNYFSVNGQMALICPAPGGRLRLGVNVDYLGNSLGRHLTRITDTSFTVGYIRTFAIKDWKL